MDGFIGEIRAFCFNYVPQGWLACNGATVPIAQYQALYTILGATYGPATAQTFTLPNLQGMAPMHAGAAPGLQEAVAPGDDLGAQSVTLTLSQLPAHTHQVSGALATSASTMSPAPNANTLLSRPMSGNTAYWSLSNLNQPNTTMSDMMVQPTGGSAPHNNMQPFLALNFCICVDGEYPVPPQ